MVDQHKVIDSLSAQFNNSMLQAVTGEINDIDDSYPSNGMEVYNTTHYFNEASRQAQQADCREVGIQTKYQLCNWYKDNQKSKMDANGIIMRDKAKLDARHLMHIQTWNWTLVDVYKCTPSCSLQDGMKWYLTQEIIKDMSRYEGACWKGCNSIWNYYKHAKRIFLLEAQVNEMNDGNTREDTYPIAICQWSVLTSSGLNPLDASADSGSNIDSSDESNKDGDLRNPIAPPVTSLRMAKVILFVGTTGFWSYEMSDTLVRMSVNTSGEKGETHVRGEAREICASQQKCGCTKEVADDYFKTEKCYLAEILEMQYLIEKTSSIIY
ncbi:hypothetical protein AgCh_022961 [Apium graveolens]